MLEGTTFKERWIEERISYKHGNYNYEMIFFENYVGTSFFNFYALFLF